jgi:hypothetical protein
MKLSVIIANYTTAASLEARPKARSQIADT